MMIWPQHPDEFVEAALKLIFDVGHIRSDIGWLTAALEDDTIFVVAKRGGAHPGRAVLLVEIAFLAQQLNAFLQRAAGIKRMLAEPDIEIDAEALHCLVNAIHDDLSHAAAEFNVPLFL